MKTEELSIETNDMPSLRSIPEVQRLTSEEVEERAKDFSEDEWKDIAEALWSLLDDIDTASDIYKPQMDGFYKCIMEKVARRFKYMSSDGYSLFPIKRSKE